MSVEQFEKSADELHRDLDDLNARLERMRSEAAELVRSHQISNEDADRILKENRIWTEMMNERLVQEQKHNQDVENYLHEDQVEERSLRKSRL
ncbi:hypothetical protein A2239_01410 [Candidatus Uhrbacteria bacterium RIFOXYA2_FULL_40_9]|nr:MAG: hypothetical protein UT94_C0028G0005 [Candidatus Uhrbacteria bacterium GW2011_GWF2_40_263]OGL94266.1 MAG: hypothetical protein A2239_01410 [Candidatus Uhrbacteria bacterium RIFOXYA2_FULL_40_9]OGL98311.1 MAG: hypothetical protein A2332_03725 [Candidatus Uhrbacteria bacterium RIFOXYB2_FULL_41_18]OGY88936.1 MAG: hypothetical protein A2458_00285 [Candidatus Kerfeldbacteria bacterium RIFOXYC2_FULL_38_9]HBK34986.1 hypothetical protein [Candidatus Uhrbacteria bacterium]